ncbi:MAG: hypothetical protein Q7R51_02195 [bacterium]|nr:hypothetical protein [bacterium]
MPDMTRTELVEKKDIVGRPKEIPNDLAHALGRGLRLTFQPLLDQTNQMTLKLKDMRNVNQKFVNPITRGVTMMDEFFGNLERAGTVRVAEINSSSDFMFSKLGPIPHTPPEGEQTLGELAKLIKSALKHNLGNKANPIDFSSIINKYAKDEDTSQTAFAIMQAYEEMRGKINILCEADDLRLTTDKEGNTTITPIYKAKTPEQPTT